MKLTRHNGRAGKNGAYNPKHNDRRFHIENSEHIDVERAKQNIYWDCYTGFSSALIREKDKENDYSFEKIEQNPCRSRNGKKKISNRSEKEQEHPSRHSLVPTKNVLMITNHSITEQTRNKPKKTDSLCKMADYP